MAEGLRGKKGRLLELASAHFVACAGWILSVRCSHKEMRAEELVQGYANNPSNRRASQLQHLEAVSSAEWYCNHRDDSRETAYRMQD